MVVKQNKTRVSIVLNEKEVQELDDLKHKYGLSSTKIFKRALELTYESEKIGSVFPGYQKGISKRRESKK